MSEDMFDDNDVEYPEEEYEISQEDVDLAGMGIDPDLADAWKKRFEKTTVLHQGFPTNTFFDWLLQSVDEAQMKILKENIGKFRETQQKRLKLAETLNLKNMPEEFLEAIMEKPKPVATDDMFDETEEIKNNPPEQDDMFDETVIEEEKPEAEAKPVKEKIIEQKKRKTPSIIVLLWGYDGTSKSEQILKFKPPPIVIDLENKLEPLAEKLGFPLENIIVASKYNEKYDISGPNTLDEIRNTIKDIRIRTKKGDHNISGVALDGITDVRPYAVAEWLHENPDRQNPNTPGDWRDINDKVRDICFRLINMGRAEDISVLFTAQVGGEYVNKVRVKDVPDCKSWISHNVDHKFKLTRDDANKRFLAYCEKSYHDPFFSIDLTDWTHGEIPSLMNILQDKTLVAKYRKEFLEAEQKLVTKNLNDDMFGG